MTNTFDQFKIKGTAINNLKKYVSVKIGVDFFDQIANEVGLTNKNLILASKWYPVMTFIDMQKKAAKHMKMSDREFGIASAQYILEEDLNGVYKFFIRMSGVPKILSRLPQMANAYASFIEMELLKNTQGKIIAKYRIPAAFSDWYFDGSEGAIRGILTVCKAEFISMKVESKVVDHTSMGDYTTLTYELNYLNNK